MEAICGVDVVEGCIGGQLAGSCTSVAAFASGGRLNGMTSERIEDAKARQAIAECGIAGRASEYSRRSERRVHFIQEISATA